MSFDDNFEGYDGIKMRNGREGNTMTAREINPRPQQNSIAEAAQRMGPRPGAPLENPDMECFRLAVRREHASLDRDALYDMLAHAFHDEYVTIGAEEFYRRHPGWKEFGVPYRSDRFEVGEEMIPVQNPGKPPAEYMDEMVPKYARSFKKKCRGMTIGELKKFAKKHKHTADELRGKNKTQVYNLMAQRFAAWKWHQKPLAARTKISTAAEGSAWSEDYDQPIWLAIRKWAKEKGVKDKAMITKLGKVNTVSKLKTCRDLFANTLKNKYERDGWPKAKDYGTAIRTVIARLKGKPVSKKKMRNPGYDEDWADPETPDDERVYQGLGLFGYMDEMTLLQRDSESANAWYILSTACKFATLLSVNKAWEGKKKKQNRKQNGIYGLLGEGRHYQLNKKEAGQIIYDLIMGSFENIAQYTTIQVTPQGFLDDLSKVTIAAGEAAGMAEEGFAIVEYPPDIWNDKDGLITDKKIRQRAKWVFPMAG